ncbi:MAG: hypothetical protein H7Z42_08620, partial [Roseiflexaceae bacterium]|nr:hypothetical protein [Roseiflexaceae bacterium]
MSLSELLAIIGRSWSRLLLYPGGLTLLALMLGASFVFRLFPAWLVPLAAPWLAVALLPLPGAIDLGRGIDVVVALALLDLPLLCALALELRGDPAQQRTGARRLAAALNGYPGLLLALLLLATNGSLELAQLALVPVQPELALTHWAGAAALVLALPAVIGLGAFATPAPPQLALALRTRQIGYAMLALLPLLAPLEGLWLVAPPPLLALALWLFHRRTREQPARRWAQALLA